jgi:TRAP-type transport system periplasmic protein
LRILNFRFRISNHWSPVTPYPSFTACSLFLLFILSFLQALLPLTVSAEKVVLKIGTLAPEGSTWVKSLRDIDQELGRKTGGQIVLRIFPGGVLGDEEDMLRKIKVNQIQGGFFTGGGLGLIYKDIKIMAIPFLLENYSEADALMTKMIPYFEKGTWDNGFKLLGWGESGFIYLFSKNPIKNAAELRKGKVWIWEDTAMGRAVFRELGINAIPLGIPDVLVSLQTGMIDTVYASPLAALSMQWFTRVSYMTDAPLSYSVGALFIQKAAYEKIPAALQGIVQETIQRHMALMKEQVRKENQKAMGVLQKQGIKFIKPSALDLKEMQALCIKGVDSLGEEVISKKTLSEVKAFSKTLQKEK